MDLNLPPKEVAPHSKRINRTEDLYWPSVYSSLPYLIFAACVVAAIIILSPVLTHIQTARIGARSLRAAMETPQDERLAKQAVTDLERAAHLNPADPSVISNLGMAYRLAGDLPRAIRDLARAASLQPTSLLHLQNLALTYDEAGLYDRAEVIWQKLNYSPVDMIHLGEQSRAAGNPQVALQFYCRAARIDASLADPWYYQGLVADSTRNWAEAQRLYERASNSERFAIIGQSDALTREAMALQRQSEKQWPQALEHYQRALQYNTFHESFLEANSYYEVGHISELIYHDDEAAIQAYRSAIALRPNHQWALLRLGRLLYSVQGDVSGAEDAFRQVIRLIPENIDHKWAYRWLADMYRDIGRTDDAVAAYREAARIDPSDEAIRESIRTLQRPAP
jgi:tetratricopeptide (TPR) repeat protein